MSDFASFTEGESRYCAAELISADSSTLDFAKADMFSLGASLYELCTGEPLSAGSQEDSSQWLDLRRGVLFGEKHNIKLCLDSLSYEECTPGVATYKHNPVWNHYPEDLIDTLRQVTQTHHYVAF